MSLRAVADLQTYGLADSLAGPLEDVAIDTECKEIDYEVHLRQSIDAVDFKCITLTHVTTGRALRGYWKILQKSGQEP